MSTTATAAANDKTPLASRTYGDGTVEFQIAPGFYFEDLMACYREELAKHIEDLRDAESLLPGFEFEAEQAAYQADALCGHMFRCTCREDRNEAQERLTECLSDIDYHRTEIENCRKWIRANEKAYARA